MAKSLFFSNFCSSFLCSLLQGETRKSFNGNYRRFYVYFCIITRTKAEHFSTIPLFAEQSFLVLRSHCCCAIISFHFGIYCRILKRFGISLFVLFLLFSQWRQMRRQRRKIKQMITIGRGKLDLTFPCTKSSKFPMSCFIDHVIGGDHIKLILFTPHGEMAEEWRLRLKVEESSNYWNIRRRSMFAVSVMHDNRQQMIKTLGKY